LRGARDCEQLGKQQYRGEFPKHKFLAYLLRSVQKRERAMLRPEIQRIGHNDGMKAAAGDVKGF
jgi:hypothetical protein